MSAGDAGAGEPKAKSNAADVVFAAHPSLDVYYRTSDGTPFFTHNAAEVHATVTGLKDKTVKKITR